MGSVNKVDEPLLARAIELYAGLNRSLPQIAEEIHWPVSRVRTELIRAGVAMRGRVEAMTIAKREGRGISSRSGKYMRTPETLKRLSDSRKKWGQENARGYRITSNGYIALTRGPHKGRLLHDVIAEAVMGRPLEHGEDVHHDNEQKQDNHPRNLIVMWKSEHIKLHRQRRAAVSHG